MKKRKNNLQLQTQPLFRFGSFKGASAPSTDPTITTITITTLGGLVQANQKR